MSKYLLLGISAFLLLSGFQLEARTHVGLQFGAGCVERRVCRPVYVEEFYYDNYPCYYEGHAPVGCRRVYVQPAYYERVYVQPRPMFSFSFFR